VNLRARISLALTYVLLAIASGVTLAPFAYLVCGAFKTRETFFSSHFLPRGSGFLGVDWGGLTLEHLARLFLDPSLRFGSSLLNSVFYATVSGTLSTLCAAMGGYALARFVFRGRSLALALVLGSLIVPAPLLLAPGYALIHRLGLLDTFAGLILPGLAPAFGVYLFRQSILNSVPTDLLEAARMDGCGEIRIFFEIVLPLCRPMLGAFLMISVIGAWNNFIGPQIILQSPERFPLAVAIAQVKGIYGTDYGLLMAGTLVSILPIMALFIGLQREFIEGLTSGAVKG
jgi:ABC-type glycerol-3-phosphate transport system permease component